MYNTLTRGQNIFGFFTTVAFVVASIVAFSDLTFPREPRGTIESTNIQVVKGRPHYYSTKKEEYAIIKFSLDADLSSLFTWNTKQLFVYVTAEWTDEKTGTLNEAVIWDEIITSPSADHLSNKGPAAMKKLRKNTVGPIDKTRGLLKLKNQKPKYQITHPSGKIAETTDVKLRVNYNVQPSEEDEAPSHLADDQKVHHIKEKGSATNDDGGRCGLIEPYKTEDHNGTCGNQTSQIRCNVMQLLELPPEGTTSHTLGLGLEHVPDMRHFSLDLLVGGIELVRRFGASREENHKNNGWNATDGHYVPLSMKYFCQPSFKGIRDELAKGHAHVVEGYHAAVVSGGRDFSHVKGLAIGSFLVSMAQVAGGEVYPRNYHGGRPNTKTDDKEANRHRSRACDQSLTNIADAKTPHPTQGTVITEAIPPLSLADEVAGWWCLRLRYHSGRSIPNGSWGAASATTPALSPPLSNHRAEIPFESRDEARYFMHYVKDLSSWVDICDKRCHFATEVPRRACNFPLLADSIIAFSSRHISLISPRAVDPTSPATYYSRALQRLIPILDGPIEAFSEDILAAIVLLRSYEEMSGTHLSGSSRLLNSSASSLVAKGGLGEAASWIVLRQDIYLSLTKSQPLSISLENYKHSSSFTGMDAESTANRIVFLCGRILAYTFRPDYCLDFDGWDALNHEVDAWHASKPWHSSPYWVESPGKEPIDGERSSAFPAAWLANLADVAGYQYYFLAHILLAIFNPRLCKASYDTFMLRREADATVQRNLRLLIGVAISNDSVTNARFTASHALQAFGSYLTDPREQQEALSYLAKIEESMGWQTRHIADKLRAQWEQEKNASKSAATFESCW
ncbi:hypothetical protein MKZ38_004651 [Zalerion maritima]|uniref:Signal peptidase complex subunit 3 n=1 Tax=Zalerion maritima TaxID=339359 RepID=A0AAD5RMA8_9PEZI|nr:hypothetical protein MKZ38_004651 [Zalerion maritima]